MKCKMLAVLALTVVSVAASAQVSPNISFNVGPSGHSCGLFTGTYYCSGIPITQTNQDGSVTYSTLFMDLYYQGNYDFVQFSNGLDNLGLAHVTSVSSSGDSTVVQFEGPDPAYVPYPDLPSPPYTGTLTFTMSTYRGCSGGRTYSCHVYWTITGGTISIVY